MSRVNFFIRALMSLQRRVFQPLIRRAKETHLGLRFVQPCYVVSNRLHSNSVILDIGTGHDADFSQALIHKYGVRSYGCDPTEKHHTALNTVVTKTEGAFTYVPFALAEQSGMLTFHESEQNVSGSLFSDHCNIKKDRISSYQVRAVTLDELCSYLQLAHADLVKMDIEGGEYGVIRSFPDHIWNMVDQFVIEFHHHCIDRFTWEDTQDCITLFEQHGFQSYTRDRINYTFFRTQ